ncbi:MAG: CPBP family glutamic-type intramembrane protease, partial [Spirochaetota bacterium]
PLCIGNHRPGELFGDEAFLMKNPHFYSVRAIENVKLLKLDGKIFRISNKPPLGSRLKGNLGESVANKMRNSSEILVQALQDQIANLKIRVGFGHFLATIMILFSIYAFLLRIIGNSISNLSDTAVISVPITFLYAIGIYWAMVRSQFPLSAFGLTLQDWKKRVAEAILWSIPILMLIVLVKWILIQFVPSMSNDYVLDFSRSRNMSTSTLIFSILAYAVFTPIQEFSFRCGIQSSLAIFYSGSHSVLFPIFFANLVFSMGHIHLSTLLAFLVFPPGLFWGWLFYKQKSLIGISVSHLIVGVFGYYIVGFKSIM